MKSVRGFALALAISGIGATNVMAQSSVPGGYPSTGRYAAPALLPLPELNQSWVGQATHVAPQANAGRPANSAASNNAYQYTATHLPAVQTVAYPARQPVYQTANVNRYYQPSVPEAVPTPAPNNGAFNGPSNGGAPNYAPSTGGMPSVAQPIESSVPGHLGGPSELEQAAAGYCGDCGVDLPSCCQPRWFGYLGGLVMTRDNPNKMWTTYETGNNPNQLMHFPNTDYSGGGEVRFGRVFGGGCGSGCDTGCGSGGCDLTAVEFTYWGVWDVDGEDSIRSDANQLSTPINLGFVTYGGPGDPASNYFDSAREHRVSRHDEFHNFELNFINYNMPMGCDHVQVQWLLGARFFKFDEFIQFGSVSGGNEFGSDGGINEAYLNVDVENNLYGVQLGGRIDYRVGCKWRLFAAPKFGLFANDIDLATQSYRGDGTYATFEETGNRFDLGAGKTDVSFLGQIDLGTTWDFSKCWSATVGYRAVAITGVALADDQIPPYLAAEGDWTDVDSAGSLVLHGAFAGLEFRW